MWESGFCDKLWLPARVEVFLEVQQCNSTPIPPSPLPFPGMQGNILQAEARCTVCGSNRSRMPWLKAGQGISVGLMLGQMSLCGAVCHQTMGPSATVPVGPAWAPGWAELWELSPCPLPAALCSAFVSESAAPVPRAGCSHRIMYCISLPSCPQSSLLPAFNIYFRGLFLTWLLTSSQFHLELHVTTCTLWCVHAGNVPVQTNPKFRPIDFKKREAIIYNIKHWIQGSYFWDITCSVLWWPAVSVDCKFCLFSCFKFLSSFGYLIKLDWSVRAFAVVFPVPLV